MIGIFSFNWWFVFVLYDVFDYVVVYEICYFVEMNYGFGFWVFVEKWCFVYIEVKEWLDEYGWEILVYRLLE